MEITKSSTNNPSNLSPFFQLINNLSLTSICQLNTNSSKKDDQTLSNTHSKRKLEDNSNQDLEHIQKKFQTSPAAAPANNTPENENNSETLPSEENSTKSPTTQKYSINSLMTPNKTTEPSESSSFSKSKISLMNDFVLQTPYKLIHDKFLNTQINGGNIIKPKPLRPINFKSEYGEDSTKSNSKQSPISESEGSNKKKDLSRHYGYKIPAAFLNFAEFNFPETINYASKNEDPNSAVRKSSRRKPRDSIIIESREPNTEIQKNATSEFIKNLEIILKKKDINEKKAKDMLKKNNWAVSRALLTVKKNIPFYVNYFMK